MTAKKSGSKINEVHLLVSHPRGGKWRKPLLGLAQKFLKTLKLTGVELSVALVSDRAIAALNRTWRKKDRPTDVLSFSLGDAKSLCGPRLLGDVVLSLDTAHRSAKERGDSLEKELALYLAHGLLHLLGHDHADESGRRKMSRLERKLLGEAGMLERAGF